MKKKINNSPYKKELLRFYILKPFGKTFHMPWKTLNQLQAQKYKN